MGGAQWVRNSANISFLYSLPSRNISFGIFSFWSGEMHTSKSLGIPWALATGRVWHPFSASDRLRCVRWERDALNILRYSVGCDAFSGRPIGAGEIEGNHYETLVYLNLATQKHVQNRMIMASYPSLQTIFQICLRNLRDFLYRKGKGRNAWMIPVHFSCMRFYYRKWLLSSRLVLGNPTPLANMREHHINCVHF